MLNEGGPGIRRTKSHDGSVRPIRADGGGGRRPSIRADGGGVRRPKSSQDTSKRLTRSFSGDNDTAAAAAAPTSLLHGRSSGRDKKSATAPPTDASQEPEKQPQRSSSRDPRRHRRQSTNPSGSDERADAGRRRRQSAPETEIEIAELQDSPERKPRRRGPARTKSVDMSQSARFSSMQASGRRGGPRRTMSSDGSDLQVSSRRFRNVTDSPSKNSSQAALGRSLSHISGSTSLRKLPSRSFSSSGSVGAEVELSPISRADGSIVWIAHGDRKPPSTRQKMPNRSKSHDGSSAPLVKRSSRDRENGSKEGRPHRRHPSSSKPSAVASGKTSDSNANIASSAAERRAQAHAIMRD